MRQLKQFGYIHKGKGVLACIASRGRIVYTFSLSNVKSNNETSKGQSALQVVSMICFSAFLDMIEQ
jgi:hypothetical protein